MARKPRSSQGGYGYHVLNRGNARKTVLRYVERNPLRANLVERAEDWRGSSAGPIRDGTPLLAPGPVRRPTDWLTFVNERQTD